jgi:hypothetical protein
MEQTVMTDYLAHNAPMEGLTDEIAAVAARMVVEEGLEFGLAKRRAIKQMGLSPRTTLPDNRQMEMQVQEYIDCFCADTQPTELRVLRVLALAWMERLGQFRPHVSGAVWHGYATRHSDITLQLFCDDPKSAEIGLIDRGVRFDVHTVTGLHGETVEALVTPIFCPDFESYVNLHLLIYDFDDLRGAVRPDGQGRRPRGDKAALLKLVHDDTP